MVSIEGQLSPLYCLILDKYFDKDSYTTCNLSFFFHPKMHDTTISVTDSCDFASLTRAFTPMPYSLTTSYIFEMVYRILNDDKTSNKYIHKKINLREVINLKAASNLSNQATSVSDSKITYGEISQLAMFLVDRIKSEGIFEGDNEKDR